MSNKNASAKIVGIDPGKQGGIAVIDFQEGSLHQLVKMPEGTHDLIGILSELVGDSPRLRVAVEEVSPFHGASSTSSFTFGRGFGRLEGVLDSLGIPWEPIKPQAWMRGLRIPPRIKRGAKKESQKHFKLRLRDHARRLFPQASIWESSQSKQLEVCDALLIAECYRRLNLGLLNKEKPRRKGTK
jgi:hypothetical protein